MGLIETITGTVRFEVTSADTPGLLRAASDAGIILLDVVDTGGLKVCASVKAKHFLAAEKLIARRDEKLRVLSRSGLLWPVLRLRRRPVLLCCMILLLALTVLLPTRVLFVRVEGNSHLPTQLIIEHAQRCGIDFGAKRSKVRSEKVKNALIASLPELQWAGVNTKGCLAVISVQEKTQVQQPSEEQTKISSIIAARDGIILDCTATRGTLLCKPGEAVKEGQVLISGYTDCGIILQATRAEGEIFAQTQRPISVIASAEAVKRTDITHTETKYSIRIGKKLINFFKDSGILDTTCVKMYSEDYLTLPGGLRLPVALVTQHCVYYNSSELPPEQLSFDWLEDFSRKYLQQHMTAGEILHEAVELKPHGSVFTLDGLYACREMIGMVRDEENLQYDGKSK